MTRSLRPCLFGFMSQNQSICVYCGSQPGNHPKFEDAARVLGQSIAGHGLRTVYGGGTSGLMGAVAEAAIDAGGPVTGIIPGFLKSREAGQRKPAGI